MTQPSKSELVEVIGIAALAGAAATIGVDVAMKGKSSVWVQAGKHAFGAGHRKIQELHRRHKK